MAYSSFSISARRGLILAARQISALSLVVMSTQICNAAPVQAGAAETGAQAKILINQTEAKINAAKAITYTYTTTMMGLGDSKTPPPSAECILQKPGQFSCAVTDMGKEVGKVTSSLNGGYVYNTAKNQYTKVEKSDTPAATLQKTLTTAISLLPSTASSTLPIMSTFLTNKYKLLMDAPVDGQAKPQVRLYYGNLNGKPVNHVTQLIQIKTMSLTVHVYTDRVTNLPVRLAFTTKASGREGGIQIDFSKFELSDTPLPDSTFEYTPPATATAYTPPAAAQPQQEQPILAAGATAPNFAIQDVTGKTAHLADFAGKVVVIDFWSTWCGPCQMSLPDTDKIAKKYKSRGVVFLPICSWDDKSAFTPWVKKRKSWTMTFYFDPAGRGAKNIASDLYKVSGIPTQFVIGKNGKVAEGFVGYDGPEGEKKLSKAIDKAIAGS